MRNHTLIWGSVAVLLVTHVTWPSTPGSCTR